MEIADLEIVELELKYCERCGGLWMRRQGTEDVYCASCVLQMSEFSLLPRRRTKPRLPANGKIKVKNQCGAQVVLCEKGGNA